MYTLLLFLNNSVAQSTATVYTPNGTPVTVLVLTEMSQSQINATNAQAAAAYPNATIVSNSSSKYNCHGYAWYLTECTGCTEYWMNTPNDDKYWQDCSYVEVSEAQAQKISYANDDHSAVKSSVSGKYDSKWGQWPVMRHSPTYTPYNSTNLKYYLKPSMSGPSNMCGTTETFNVTAPSGATVTWSISPSSAATFPSGSSTSKTFTKNSSFNGFATISATIVGDCSWTITREVSIGLPVLNITSGITMCSNYITEDSKYIMPVSPGATTYNLVSSSSNLKMNGTTNYTTTTAPKLISFVAPIPGNYMVTFTASNSCGSVSTTFPVVSYRCPGGPRERSFNVYPNPSSSTIFVDLGSEPENSTEDLEAILDPNGRDKVFDAEIYDFSGNQVKRLESNRLKQEIDISYLERGTYFLRITGKEVDEVHQIIKE